MSNQLPASLDEDAEEIKRQVMAYMSGEEGLEVFCRELREKGIELPKRSVWEHAERKNIEAAVHATFSMLGGVPGMALWAHQNRGEFYKSYMKLAPAESVLGGAANIFINTAVPESDLDVIEIDHTGRIKEFKDIK